MVVHVDDFSLIVQQIACYFVVLILTPNTHEQGLVNSCWDLAIRLEDVGKLGGAMGKTGEKQIGNRNVREMKEGKDPPSFLPPPLIKIRVFNWSKLI